MKIKYRGGGCAPLKGDFRGGVGVDKEVKRAGVAQQWQKCHTCGDLQPSQLASQKSWHVTGNMAGSTHHHFTKLPVDWMVKHLT